MKNSISKKILSLVLVILMLCIPLMTASCSNLKPKNENPKDDDAAVLADPDRKAFIDGIGGVSETFKGTVSEESYSSSDEAAKAFVNTEVAGNDKANISSVKSKGELSKKEINELNIPADILDGSDSVEEVEVVYELVEDSSLYNGNGVTNLAAKKYTVKVYVIKYGVDWKYFAPMPVTGDTINKSYYDSVFDTEKYKNCTMEATSNIDIAISAEGESISMNISMKQLIKHADGKVYIEQKSSENLFGEAAESNIYAYLEEVDGYINCYVKMSENDDWIVTGISSIGFTSLDELVPFCDQYLDYTYFKKTAYGFNLSDENARQYFMQSLAGALDGFGIDMDGDGFKADMYAEYYVNEGVLSGMRVDADVNITITEGLSTGTIKENVSSIIKCTDYGTTVVNIPNVND